MIARTYAGEQAVDVVRNAMKRMKEKAKAILKA